MRKFEKTHIFANFCIFLTIFIHFEATSDFSNKIISIQGTVEHISSSTSNHSVWKNNYVQLSFKIDSMYQLERFTFTTSNVQKLNRISDIALY